MKRKLDPNPGARAQKEGQETILGAALVTFLKGQAEGVLLLPLPSMPPMLRNILQLIVVRYCQEVLLYQMDLLSLLGKVVVSQSSMPLLANSVVPRPQNDLLMHLMVINQ